MSLIPRIFRSETPTDAELRFLAKPFVDFLAKRLPSELELKAIADEAGIAVASMVAHDSLLASPLHGEFNSFVRARNVRPQLLKLSCEVLVVDSRLAGFAWGSHTDLIRRWARELGFTTEAITTIAQESVAANVESIRRAVAASPSENIIIVSLDRGSHEARKYLDYRNQSSADYKKVKAWLSVGGCHFGSDLYSDRYTKGPGIGLLDKARLGMRAGNKSLEHELNPKNFVAGNLSTDQVVCLQIVGICLESHLPDSRHAQWRRVSESGPCDGSTGFFRQMLDGGWAFPIWGFQTYDGLGRIEFQMKRMLLTAHDMVLMQDKEQPVDNHQPSSVVTEGDRASRVTDGDYQPSK